MPDTRRADRRSIYGDDLESGFVLAGCLAGCLAGYLAGCDYPCRFGVSVVDEMRLFVLVFVVFLFRAFFYEVSMLTTFITPELAFVLSSLTRTCSACIWIILPFHAVLAFFVEIFTSPFHSFLRLHTNFQFVYRIYHDTVRITETDDIMEKAGETMGVQKFELAFIEVEVSLVMSGFDWAKARGWKHKSEGVTVPADVGNVLVDLEENEKTGVLVAYL
nr:hypothetical protein [Tanacetum cinerariifolium]